MIQPQKIREFEAILTPIGSGANSYRMPERRFPWSVTAQEGRFLYECARLVGRALRPRALRPLAFEIATAFGYSGAWLSAGLSWNRGRLITMDSYVEETTTDLDAKAISEPAQSAPLGFQYAVRGMDLVGTRAVMHPCIAKSPEGVVSSFLHGTDDWDGWTGRKIDLFFLDGHHLNGQPLKDWNALVPLLDQHHSLTLLHDSHVGDVKEALVAVERYYGRAHVHPMLPGYNLIAVTADKELLAGLESAAEIAKAGPYASAA